MNAKSNIERSGSLSPDIKYPCLMEPKPNTVRSCVLLMTGPKVGTVVHVGDSHYNLGYYGVDFQTSMLQPWSGMISLENKE